MTNISKNLAEAFKAIKALNPDSNDLTDNALSTVDEWIDTGSYALNAIVSGSLYKGIPKGRITGLVGPTGCGKSLIINKIIGNAQRKDPDMWGLIWDSEMAQDPKFAAAVGADPDRIKHNPVETVEECRNQISAFLDNIILDKSLHGKFIIAIDSLGNLASSKEVADAAKDKDAGDMGLRAKTIKSMMRVLTYKCAKAGVTLIFSNHVYDDPSKLYPSMIKNQSGGKGPLYLASLLVQLAVTQEKAESDEKEKEDVISIANKIKGVTLKAMTVKNRFIPPFLETNLYLNFKTGLYEYTGLLEMAEAYGLIVRSGPSYSFANGEKLGYYKDWKNDKNIWDKQILPNLEKTLNKHLTYSNETKLTQDQTDGEDQN